MNRRELITRMTLLMGGSMVYMPLFISGCNHKSGKSRVSFSATEIEFLDEIAEIMIPETDTPGAKKAEVGQFLANIVPVLLDKINLESFKTGLYQIEENFKNDYGHSFLTGSSEDRLDCLNRLDNEIAAYDRTKAENDPEHFLKLMKDLIVFGFLTSEKGSKEVLRYIQTPGRHEACILYADGEKAWAI